MFAGLNDGVYRSTNKGLSWETMGLAGTRLYDLCNNGEFVLAATSNQGAQFTTDLGDKWTRADKDNVLVELDEVAVDYYSSDQTRLYAAGTGRFWRGILDTYVTTFIPSETGKVPRDYALLQNYPNPFNPRTTLSAFLPVRSTVTISIYDVLGRQLSHLSLGAQEAGRLNISWQTTEASGIYFYRLEAVSVDDPSKRFVDVKKMILLK